MDRLALWKSTFTLDDLRARGETDATIKRLYKNGELTKVRPGIYRSQGTLEFELEALSRIFAYAKMRREAVFCLESAALPHGLPLLKMPHSVHINTTGSHGTTGGVSVHRFMLGEGETGSSAEELAVTTPLRTLTDLARRKPLTEGLVLADSLVFQKLLPLEKVVSVLESTAGRGQRTVHEVAHLVRNGAQSPGETLMRLALMRLGYPEPVLQYEVATADGYKYLDAAYPELKLALEFDGEIKYGGYGEPPDRVRWKERERDRALLNEGWFIVRCKWHHCTGNSEAFATMMAKAWSARHARLP